MFGHFFANICCCINGFWKKYDYTTTSRDLHRIQYQVNLYLQCGRFTTVPLKSGGGGQFGTFFYKNVQILLARVLKVSLFRKQNKTVNFLSHFWTLAEHHVFVNNKSLVQAQFFFLICRYNFERTEKADEIRSILWLSFHHICLFVKLDWRMNAVNYCKDYKVVLITVN